MNTNTLQVRRIFSSGVGSHSYIIIPLILIVARWGAAAASQRELSARQPQPHAAAHSAGARAASTNQARRQARCPPWAHSRQKSERPRTKPWHTQHRSATPAGGTAAAAAALAPPAARAATCTSAGVPSTSRCSVPAMRPSGSSALQSLSTAALCSGIHHRSSRLAYQRACRCEQSSSASAGGRQAPSVALSMATVCRSRARSKCLSSSRTSTAPLSAPPHPPGRKRAELAAPNGSARCAACASAAERARSPTNRHAVATSGSARAAARSALRSQAASTVHSPMGST
ncbi:hypothetical protein T492DRAFT_283695 [Pavlovales sp. CCMP2436]|nr:hypothetical protein T492DRAFT_283695 [Pavlovales sp. CCMP2436]